MKKLLFVISVFLPLVLWAQDLPPLKLPEVFPDKPIAQAKDDSVKRVADIPPLSFPDMPIEKQMPEPKINLSDIPSLILPDIPADEPRELQEVSRSVNIPALILPDIPADEVIPLGELREKFEISPLVLPNMPTDERLLRAKLEERVNIPSLILPDIPLDKPVEQLQHNNVNIPMLTLPDIPITELTPRSGKYTSPLASLTLPAISPLFKEFRLFDFSGGLNKGFPTDIADNELTELINFVWEEKILAPRDGFTTYTVSEFAPGKRIWGLYPHGSKILLAGVDDTLYADTNKSGSFIAVKGGLQANGEYYYFDIFKNKAIVAHEGDYPFACDSALVTFEVGLLDSFLVRDVQIDTTANPHVCTTKVYVSSSTPKSWGVNDKFAGCILSNQKNYRSNAYTFRIVAHDDSVVKTFYWGSDYDEDTLASILEQTWVYVWGLFSWIPIDTFPVQDMVVCDSTVRYPDEQDHICIRCKNLTDLDTSVNYYARKNYVAHVLTGWAKGQERIIDSSGVHWTGPTNGDMCLAIDEYFWEATGFVPPSMLNDTVEIRQLVFYRPSIVKTYKNRIFFVHDDKYPNAIFFSENNSFGFLSDNYFVVKTEGGSPVTALATFYEDQLGYKDQSKDCLVIFTNNSIYKLVWNSSTDYGLVQVVEGIGCIAPQTVVNVEGKYLLFLHTTGVYAFDGRTVTLVSGKIDPIIENMGGSIDEVAGGYYDRHYYLNYPSNVLIEGFEDTSGWSSGASESIIENDTSYRREGDQSIRVTNTSHDYGYCTKSVDWDLSNMKTLVFGVYIHDLSKLYKIRVLLSTTADFSKYFYRQIFHYPGDWDGSQFKPGWNIFVLSPDAQWDFHDSGDVSWSDRIVKIQFEHHTQAGETLSVSWDNLRIDYPGKAKCIITIDDGLISMWTKAKSILDGNGQKGVIFVNSDYVGTEPYMSKAQLEVFRDAGWDISNHTSNHLYLDTASQEDMEAAIDDGYDWLVDNGFGETAKFFCYPGGEYNDAVITKLRERHVLARSTIEGLWETHISLGDDDRDMIIKRVGVGSTHLPPQVKGWIDNVINRGGLMVPMFHKFVESGATGGTEYNVADFEEISDYLKAKSGAGLIDVITFSEYYDGIPEWEQNYNSLVFNVDLGSWGKTNLRAGIFAKQTSIDKRGKLLFSTPDYNSLIYEFGTSEQDTGQSIFLSLKSKVFSLGDIHRNKRFLYFDMDYYLELDSLNTYFYTGFGNNLRYNFTVNDAGGYRHTRIPLDMNYLGRNFAFKLTSDSKFKLGSISLKFLETGE